MNETASQLDTLKQRRRTASAELAGISGTRDRLSQAQQQENDILRQIGELGAAEVEAMRQWASSGDGPMPIPDAGKRAGLNNALVAAQAAATAAKGASADLDERQRGLVADLALLDEQIADAAYDAMTAEQTKDVQAFVVFLNKDVKPRLAKLQALHSYLSEQGQHQQAAGRSDRARAVFGRLGQIASETPSDVNTTLGEVISAMTHWSDRFAALTRDETSTNVVRLGSAA